jgi:hypothetical protein
MHLRDAATPRVEVQRVIQQLGIRRLAGPPRAIAARRLAMADKNKQSERLKRSRRKPTGRDQEE